MAKRGFVNLVKNIFSVTQKEVKDKIKFIGEDLEGNRYFEVDRPNRHRRISRFFYKQGADEDLDIIKVGQVHPAWDAWLRYRRKDPPTKEELIEQDNYFRSQQQKAQENKATEPKKDDRIVFGSKRQFPKLPFDKEIR